MWINIPETQWLKVSSLNWLLDKCDVFRIVNVLNRILLTDWAQSSRLSHNCSYQWLLQKRFGTKLSHANVITCKRYDMQILNQIILHTAAINSHSISLHLNSKLPNLVHWIYFNSLLTAISHYIHSSGLKHAKLWSFHELPWFMTLYF